VPDVSKGGKKRLAMTRIKLRLTKKTGGLKRDADCEPEATRKRPAAKPAGSASGVKAPTLEAALPVAAGPTICLEEAMKHLPNLDGFAKAELVTLPKEAAPCGPGKGCKNYTICADGHDDMSCEVQLHNKCFRVNKLPEGHVWPDGVSKCVKWTRQSPFQAWAEFKSLVGWPENA